jgi:hypothetical protein
MPWLYKNKIIYTLPLRAKDNTGKSYTAETVKKNLHKLDIIEISGPPSYNERTHKLEFNFNAKQWKKVKLTKQEIKDRDKNLWEKIKATRNKFLMETDWTEISYNTDIDLYGIPSNIIDKPMKKLYEKYRQELRDIPQKYNDPKDVIFPMTPQAILRELELLKIERELIEKEQKEIQKQEIKRITTSSDKLV